MVIHENIDPRRPLYEYVVDKSFLNSAKKLSAFIYSINPELRVYCYQYPTNQSYTCWYVGFADRQNPYILHFNIEHTERRDGSEYRVWFRRPEYSLNGEIIRILSNEGYKKTEPDQNFRRMCICELGDDVHRIITDYVKIVREPLMSGNLKPEKNHRKCQL